MKKIIAILAVGIGLSLQADYLYWMVDTASAEAYETLKENCGDILEDAKEINREISAEREAEMIEDAKAVLASAEEKA